MAGVKTSYYHHQKPFFPDQHTENYDGPNFVFPTTPSSVLHHVHDKITTAKSILTSVFESTVKNVTKQNVTSVITADKGINSSNGTAVIDEATNTNSTTALFNPLENANSSVITDLLKSNGTVAIANMTDNQTTTTTTEKVVTYIADSTKNVISTSTTRKYDWSYGNGTDNLTMSHQGYESEDSHYQTTHVVMGVVIAILVVIVAVMAYFYFTYKKKHVLPLHGQYKVGETGGSKTTSLENDGQSNFKC